MADEIPPPSPGMGMPPPPPPDAPRANPMPRTTTTPEVAPSAPMGAIKVESPNMPPIALAPNKEQRVPASAMPNKEMDAKDTIRELMETIVFVVVLVLMLKTFLAEAFVIPTGSMADTLLGYHYKVACSQCGYRNLVNASSEAEPQRGDQPQWIVSCQCQNCGATNTIRNIPHIQPEGRP